MSSSPAPKFDITPEEIELRFPGTMFALDNDVNILYWSEAAAAMYGHAIKTAVGKNFRELIRFEMIGQSEVDAWQVLVRDGHWRGDAYHHHADGTKFRVHCHTQFVTDYKGVVMGIAVQIEKA
jgi:PAS domain S-box-containing protein